MARKITYWIATGLMAALSLFAGYAYVSGSAQAVEGFAHVGYPQQLRVLLGVAKLLGYFAGAGIAETERVGLFRIHVCVDRGVLRALFGQGWREGLCAAGAAGVAGRVVRHAAAQPPLGRESSDSG